MDEQSLVDRAIRAGQLGLWGIWEELQAFAGRHYCQLRQHVAQNRAPASVSSTSQTSVGCAQASGPVALGHRCPASAWREARS